MGNPDLVFIFNETIIIFINGLNYTDRNNAINKALEEYNLKKQCALMEYKDALQNTPERVVKDYDIDNDWEIKSIKIYKK